MYTHNEYESLKKKYGPYSSWAIWDENDTEDTSIIDKKQELLNPRYIFLGLNIASPLRNSTWANFHGGKHDRKLMRACSDTKLAGSYLTDIFKNIPESKSKEFKKYIDKNFDLINKNVEYFNEEMRNIKIDNNTIFIVLGVESSIVSKYFKEHFMGKYQNRVVNYYHHSYYGKTDKEWVDGLLEKINVK